MLLLADVNEYSFANAGVIHVIYEITVYVVITIVFVLTHLCVQYSFIYQDKNIP